MWAVQGAGAAAAAQVARIGAGHVAKCSVGSASAVRHEATKPTQLVVATQPIQSAQPIRSGVALAGGAGGGAGCGSALGVEVLFQSEQELRRKNHNLLLDLKGPPRAPGRRALADAHVQERRPATRRRRTAPTKETIRRRRPTTPAVDETTRRRCTASKRRRVRRRRPATTDGHRRKWMRRLTSIDGRIPTDGRPSMDEDGLTTTGGRLPADDDDDGRTTTDGLRATGDDGRQRNDRLCSAKAAATASWPGRPPPRAPRGQIRVFCRIRPPLAREAGEEPPPPPLPSEGEKGRWRPGSARGRGRARCIAPLGVAPRRCHTPPW